jgi:CO/xanthine dehydrogenase Mo-binding subunit
VRKRGIGFSCSFQGTNYHFGHPDTSNASLEITETNEFIIHSAASDLGQGLEASLIKIVSDVFGGLPAKNIHWKGADTSEPDSGSTGASRQTTITGNALHEACLAFKARLAGVAAEMLDIPPDQLVFLGEIVKGGGVKIPLVEVLDQARRENLTLQVSARFSAPPTTPVDEWGKGEPINQFGYATHVAEVEVDTETGEVFVLKITAYHDAGHILHQIGAEGQVEGGITMGMGFAITEEFLQDKGQPLNVGFTNYLIPTIADAPEIKSNFVYTKIPTGKLGVKGMAEIPTATVAPAITNAIFDATGARVTCIPATPERVLAAIQRAAQEKIDS